MKRMSLYSTQLMTQVSDYVKPVYDQILEQISQINEIKISYKQLKNEKLENYRALLKAHKLKLKLAQVELSKNLAMWKSFLRADLQALIAFGQVA